MIKFVIILLAILNFGQSFGQRDKNGNPVFNSISTSEKTFDSFLLISNYYTLKNNIESKESSVFISENPTLDDIEGAAVKLPSDFFILTKKSKMIAMVVIQNHPKREFITMVKSTNQQSTSPCRLQGDITENRAKELIKERYDSSAGIENSVLTFNGKKFQIISDKEIEEAVLDLIKKEKLDKKKPSDIILPSKKELKEYILSESKEGGKLDFFTEIKGKEYDGIQVKPGVFSTKIGIALYKWGRACFDIGVNTVEDAFDIFSEFKKREINRREKDYIKMGFYKELEK
jgi:hypothetical protein